MENRVVEEVKGLLDKIKDGSYRSFEDKFYASSSSLFFDEFFVKKLALGFSFAFFSVINNMLVEIFC